MTKREEIEELKRRVTELERSRFVPSPYQTGGSGDHFGQLPMKCSLCGTAFFGTHICGTTFGTNTISFGETGNELQ